MRHNPRVEVTDDGFITAGTDADGHPIIIGQACWGRDKHKTAYRGGCSTLPKHKAIALLRRAMADASPIIPPLEDYTLDQL